MTNFSPTLDVSRLGASEGARSNFFVVAGPCLAESKELLRETARVLKPLCASLGLPYAFKASYRKANRTSASSFEGIGDERALGFLAEIRTEFDAPVVTDIHSASEAEHAALFGIDVLQIPAFLSRQTDIIKAAAETGKVVNVKKGQFLAPDDMAKAVEKVRQVPAQEGKPVWVTERGASFGYHDLVVDFRSLVVMRESLRGKNCAVVYDATHSVQQPSAGEQSGGRREFVPALARAAVAVGIDGLFFETHPNPKTAQSDSATQLPLAEAERFLTGLAELHKTAALWA